MTFSYPMDVRAEFYYRGLASEQGPDSKRIQSAIISAQERIEEWSYEQDAHGYCHDRTDWIALLLEIERLQERLDAQEAVVTAAREYEKASTDYSEIMPITNGHEAMLRDAEIEAHQKLISIVRSAHPPDNEPLDLDAVKAEIEAYRNAEGWRALVRQQMGELVAKDALIKHLEEASASQQVEIERLNVLLQQAHAEADELLYPNTGVNGDPDWYIRQQGADDMFHRTGEP